jgi:hypothetical protein
MSDGFGGAQRTVSLVLYTDACVIKGKLTTPHRRISDALNEAPDGFLVLADASFDTYKKTALIQRAEFAQVNLGSVLFVVSDEIIDPDPARATAKAVEEAFIAVPPFTVTGHIHVIPERPLADALGELRGRFIPVTNATHWSDPLGEARTSAALVAVNHARCQILAPHQEVDPWAGLPAGEAAPPPAEPTGW